MLDQINAGLARRRDFFKKNIKPISTGIVPDIKTCDCSFSFRFGPEHEDS